MWRSVGSSIFQLILFPGTKFHVFLKFSDLIAEFLSTQGWGSVQVGDFLDYSMEEIASDIDRLSQYVVVLVP